MVGSILTLNGRRPLVSPSQIEEVRFGSDQLMTVLSDMNAIALYRTFPKSDPSDTLWWDTLTQQWYHLPDLSRYHKIKFPTTVEVNTMIQALDTIDGFRTVEPIPIPIPDDRVCSLWIPDDTYYGWHLSERNPVTLAGGANVTCAWGILAGESKGAVYIGVIDDGYEYHSDLDANVVWADDTQGIHGAIHGNPVAGLAGAVTYNSMGIAGVSPDCGLKLYNFYDDTISLDDSSLYYDSTLENSWWDAINEDTIAVISFSNHVPSPVSSLHDILRMQSIRSTYR